MHGFSTLSHVLGGEVVSTAAALVLAGLLGWAGAYKLARPAPIAQALIDFGLSRLSHPWLGRILGGVELLAGLGLLAAPTRQAAAVAAAVLAAGFAALLARAVVRGEEFNCACMGAAERVSKSSFWRAVLMAAGAALIVISPPAAPDRVTWMQAATLAALVVGTPLLKVTWDRLSGMKKQLDDELDWQLIGQSVDATALRGWPWHRPRRVDG